jgi:hypothetical protein
MEQRILRERIRDLEAAIDRRRQQSQPGTPRFLAQVYNGGNYPTSVPRVFLTNPVTIDAGDAEAATPSYTADTSQSIPVVVLNQLPAPGDILPAFADGGRWVAEKTGSSSTCNVTICVRQTCFCNEVSSATVTIKTGGGATVATGTTGTNGCVTLNIGSAGTYTVITSALGFTDHTFTNQTLACGNTYTYGIGTGTEPPFAGTTLTLSWNCPLVACAPTGSVTLTWSTTSLAWLSAEGAVFAGCIAPLTAVVSCNNVAVSLCVGAVVGHTGSGDPIVSCSFTNTCDYSSGTASMFTCDPFEAMWSLSSTDGCGCSVSWTLTG